METFEKLDYKIKAGIEDATKEKEYRLADRLLLPLKGLNGEELYLTGVERLKRKSAELMELYSNVPDVYRVTSVILLDAHSSATIEGANTTVDRMKHCLKDPETKDEVMVANTYKACTYAYEHRITETNIRKLWEIVVDGVCDNVEEAGTLYRDGMVYVGKKHVPANPDEISALMHSLMDFNATFDFDPIIKSFIYHFYFVYVHPFCDGNGRTARTINNSQLFFSGMKKIKSISISSAVNDNLSGYYNSIEACEKKISDKNKWLDISPFIEYMQDALENAIEKAVLANNSLSKTESVILSKMNKVGLNASMTVKTVAQITGLSESGSRKILLHLANLGYLNVDKTKRPYIYKLH